MFLGLLHRKWSGQPLAFLLIQHPDKTRRFWLHPHEWLIQTTFAQLKIKFRGHPSRFEACFFPVKSRRPRFMRFRQNPYAQFAQHGPVDGLQSTENKIDKSARI
jgi:hypothetical protein